MNDICIFSFYKFDRGFQFNLFHSVKKLTSTFLKKSIIT